jgi:hypothetical protein
VVPEGNMPVPEVGGCPQLEEPWPPKLELDPGFFRPIEPLEPMEPEVVPEKLEDVPEKLVDLPAVDPGIPVLPGIVPPNPAIIPLLPEPGICGGIPVGGRMKLDEPMDEPGGIMPVGGFIAVDEPEPLGKGGVGVRDPEGGGVGIRWEYATPNTSKLARGPVQRRQRRDKQVGRAFIGFPRTRDGISAGY